MLHEAIVAGYVSWLPHLVMVIFWALLYGCADVIIQAFKGCVFGFWKFIHQIVSTIFSDLCESDLTEFVTTFVDFFLGHCSLRSILFFPMNPISTVDFLIIIIMVSPDLGFPRRHDILSVL